MVLAKLLFLELELQLYRISRATLQDFASNFTGFCCNFTDFSLQLYRISLATLQDSACNFQDFAVTLQDFASILFCFSPPLGNIFIAPGGPSGEQWGAVLHYSGAPWRTLQVVKAFGGRFSSTFPAHQWSIMVPRIPATGPREGAFTWRTISSALCS